MSHYKSNVRDQVFNLFEVLGLDKALGQGSGERGARRVVGVDVGHGQLHAQLRQDPRVVCLEGINARALTPEALQVAWEEA